ncbi:MAG: DNA polymerase III subunit beta [Burkholderiaceae bacterium]|jgi:DNA polymerase-3 subunit beta
MQLIHSSRDTLIRKLQVVSNIVERRNTLPVLANVLLRKVGTTMTLLSTDIEMQVSTSGDFGLGDETVATTVAARKLLDILRSLPDGADVGLKLDGQKLTVQSGKSRFSLQTLPADEFPVVQEPAQWLANVTVSQKTLKYLLSMVYFSMAQQDLRYYLNGVLLLVEDGLLRAVATDGHRLAYAEVLTDSAVSKHEVIMPRKTVLELMRLLVDTDDPVSVDLAHNQARFQFNEIDLISKLVEGKFPDYQRVIPKGHTQHFVVGREIFLKSLQRASILTTDKFRGVRCVVSNGLLSVVVINSDQEEAHDEIEIDYAGATIDIGFNVNYLQDVLNNLKTDNIQMTLQDSNSSALITKSGSDEFKYVVMPMRI